MNSSNMNFNNFLIGKKPWIIIALILSLNYLGAAAQDTTHSPAEAITHTSDPNKIDSGTVFEDAEHGSGDNDKSMITSKETLLTIAVVFFALLLFYMEFILIKSGRIPQRDIVKTLLITLIITGTIILITAGYSNNQIAPAVGLMGTIAGYLLGKMNNETNKSNQDENIS